VFIFGSTSAVSSTVVRGVRAYTKASITRVSGGAAANTARAISAKFFPHGTSTVIVVPGTGGAEDQAAPNVILHNPGPILISGPKGLSKASLTEVKRLRATRAIIVGGAGAMETVVEGQLASKGAKSTRIKTLRVC